MTVRAGTVYLVGAGPGDPGLITMRGLELLQRADVVLHDRLVAGALLDQARTTAVVVDVGKTPWGPSTTQEEINASLVAHALLGRVVVRLKGGDPFVFGRGSEERDACRRAGVPCEVVPGISSAIAGPAAAGIPVTRRGVASSVAIVAAPVVSERQLTALSHADSCVFLMGMTGLGDLAQRLIASGRDGATPAAVIERATLPGQRTVRAPLARIAAAATAAGLRAPAVVVVGPTAAENDFASGSLSGRRIVLTHPLNAAHELADGLRREGGEVISVPLIEIAHRAVDDPTLIGRIGEFDWIAFASRHGVRGFRRAIEAQGADVRCMSRARIAAIGPTTARELEVWGIRADLVPAEARADALVAELLAAEPRPRRVLFPCGTLASEALPRAVTSQGIEIESVRVYATRRLSIDDRTRELIEQGVDAVVLASPSAATAFGESAVRIGDAAVVCIGRATADACAPFNWSRVQVAASHSDAGVIESLVDPLHS
jgi:uroporphyrinogen III methyltransferase/synthase